MADLNAVYAGVVEYFDPKGDSGIINPSTLNWFGSGGSNFWLDEMPWWSELEKINNDSASTIAAVKVPYVPAGDRTQFLATTLNAINNRVAFAKARTLDLLTTLKGQGADAYDVLMKGFTTALSAVPIVGSTVSYAVGKDSARQAVEQYKLQRLIQDYTADLEQLGQIRAQLVKEYTAADPEAGKKYEAPKTIPISYYIIGASILLFLIILYRNRS